MVPVAEQCRMYALIRHSRCSSAADGIDVFLTRVLLCDQNVFICVFVHDDNLRKGQMMHALDDDQI